MENALPAPADAVLDDRFFDVHVKGIEQQPEVVHADAFYEFQSLGCVVYERGFVTIDGFECQTDAIWVCCVAALAQGFDELGHCLGCIHSRFNDSVDQSDDNYRPKTGCNRYVTLDPFDGGTANSWVWVSERESFFSPGLSRSDGRHVQIVFADERFHLFHGLSSCLFYFENNAHVCINF